MTGVEIRDKRFESVSWGDDDLKSLFITASTSVYRVRVAVPGVVQLT